MMMRRALIILSLLWATSSYGEIKIEMNVANNQDQTYRLSYKAQIDLPEEIIEAVTSGVPIRIQLEIQSKAERWYSWGRIYESPVIFFDLIYRPLARIYQIRPSGQVPITVRDLNSGLENILNSFTYELEWNEDIDLIRSRLGVDSNYLPGPMRLTAWIKPVWRQSSGWVQWRL